MRPRHDPVPKVPAGWQSARMAERRARQRTAEASIRRARGGDGEPGGEPCPVEPNRPLDLSGGAGAALEFD